MSLGLYECIMFESVNVNGTYVCGKYVGFFKVCMYVSNACMSSAVCLSVFIYVCMCVSLYVRMMCMYVGIFVYMYDLNVYVYVNAAK